ncbi:hypothetical protein [Actinomadura roseirufa]|uniref:hypothetical protein n=1 Tax=Actinomadura roseirufa TaxID=2094049 RepID=UPI0013F177C2|nr:hypothetical protein [Actinomadura roseirufa]
MSGLLAVVLGRKPDRQTLAAACAVRALRHPYLGLPTLSVAGSAALPATLPRRELKRV